jgi:hypothetical protein
MTRSIWCGKCQRRHTVAAIEPEVPHDPRIPAVRLANLVLGMCFLYAVLGVWVIGLLKGVAL